MLLAEDYEAKQDNKRNNSFQIPRTGDYLLCHFSEATEDFEVVDF